MSLEQQAATLEYAIKKGDIAYVLPMSEPERDLLFDAIQSIQGGGQPPEEVKKIEANLIKAWAGIHTFLIVPHECLFLSNLITAHQPQRTESGLTPRLFPLLPTLPRFFIIISANYIGAGSRIALEGGMNQLRGKNDHHWPISLGWLCGRTGNIKSPKCFRAKEKHMGKCMRKCAKVNSHPICESSCYRCIYGDKCVGF